MLHCLYRIYQVHIVILLTVYVVKRYYMKLNCIKRSEIDIYVDYYEWTSYILHLYSRLVMYY